MVKCLVTGEYHYTDHECDAKTAHFVEMPDLKDWGGGYTPPFAIDINTVRDGIAKELAVELDDGVRRALRGLHVTVDEEELVKALKGERDQYGKGRSDGYAEGYRVRDSEIVRCRECKHYEPFRERDGFCKIGGMLNGEAHYCSYGERREEPDEVCRNCRYCTTRKINDRLVCCCMGQKGMPAVKPDDSCDSWKDLPEDEDE